MHDKEKEEFLNLLHLRLAKFTSKEENEYIDRRCSEDVDAEQLWKEVQELDAINDKIDKKHAWKRVYRAIMPKQTPKKKALTYCIAAALLATVILIMYHFQKSKTLFPNEIRLELSDGKTISIPKGSHSLISNNIHVQTRKDTLYIAPKSAIDKGWNTLKIPSNRHCILKLPDSTVVDLSASSELRFPIKFDKNERSVHLEGEAFFNVVSSDNLQPFIVETVKGSVTVLGTQFNVTAYNSLFTTSVVAGKVKVQAGKYQVSLSQGHKAVLDTLTGELTLQELTWEELNWYKGIYVFDRKTLTDIIPVIENWFDVTVVLVQPDKGYTYVGVIDRNHPLTFFLKNMRAIQSTFKWHFSNDTLYIDQGILTK